MGILKSLSHSIETVGLRFIPLSQKGRTQITLLGFSLNLSKTLKLCLDSVLEQGGRRQLRLFVVYLKIERENPGLQVLVRVCLVS